MSESLKSKLQMSGERFIPGEGGARLAYEHLPRYFLATQFAKDKVVLDLGCGDGYGTKLLAEVARSVVGLDISREAIEHARATYQKPNLTFIETDCCNTQLLSQAFDLIVCFEVIQHVAEHEALLSEVLRLIKPNGMFFISTPDKRFLSEAGSRRTPFHGKELDPEEFESLLKRHFMDVSFFTQKLCLGSLLWRVPHVPESQRARMEVIEMIGIGGGSIKYRTEPGSGGRDSVAVCSPTYLDPALNSFQSLILSDASEAILHEGESHAAELSLHGDQLLQRVNDCQAVIAQKDLKVAWQGQELQARDQEIRRLKEALADRETILEEQEKMVQSRDHLIEELERTVVPLREFEEKVRKSILWRFYSALLQPIRRQAK